MVFLPRGPGHVNLGIEARDQDTVTSGRLLSSYEILRCGNMSSPTVVFVLDYG
jgi:predicted naringenin-chalcone synthase